MQHWGKTKPPPGVMVNHSQPLSRGLVGCWLLNEGNGNQTEDRTANKNYGVLTGFATPKTSTNGWNPGLMGSSAVTNAANTYVRVFKNSDNPPVLNLANAYSIVCWFSLNTNVSNGGLVHFGRITSDQGSYALGFFQGVSNKMTARHRFNGASVNSTQVLALNRLYCAASTYDRSNLRLYIDGVSQGQTGDTNAITWNNLQSLNIGMYYTPAYNSKGPIEAVFIYNRALTQAEVTKHCRSPFSMFDK